MKKIKDILTNVLYGMLRSYEGKRFLPSLIAKLAISLASAVVTAFFADTLFSHNSTVNQIFAALFFYCLITAVSGLIAEIKRGGAGRRFRKAVCNMVSLKPPSLWFFASAVAVVRVLPYAFVLSLAALLFLSAVSGEHSALLGIKNAVTRGRNPEKSGKGLAAFACGLLVCGLIVCILSNLGVPTLYGVIDGNSTNNNTAQTEHVGGTDTKKPDTPSSDTTPDTAPKTDGTSADDPPTPDGGDIIVSGDTAVSEAAQILTDRLIEYAGSDRQSLERLFRNTEASVIDQYYNTSFDAFRECRDSLIAVAAHDNSFNTVWFTALYYQLPEGYPTEKEKSVYLSTIMTRADDGWKLEWNEDVRSRLQSQYDYAGFSSYGLDAMERGFAWAKFFIPFDLNNVKLFYDGAVMCKLTEMYIDESENLNLTLYVSNGTEQDVRLTGVDITVSDGERQLLDRHFDIDISVGAGDASLYGLMVYSDELDFTTWDSPRITEFRFYYEADS